MTSSTNREPRPSTTLQGQSTACHVSRSTNSRRPQGLPTLFSLVLISGTFLLTSCRIERRGVDDSAPGAAAEVTEQGTVARAEEAPRSDPNDPRSVEEHLEDASLAAQVKLALVEEKRLRLFEFEPEVRQGVVVLHGAVPSVNQYALAEQVARAVPGVRAVRNAIEAPGVEAAADSVRMQPQASDTLHDVATPAPTPSAPEIEPQAEKATYHTVESGESLWIIARKNGTTIEAIKRLNDMTSDRLRPGQRIRIR